MEKYPTNKTPPKASAGGAVEGSQGQVPRESAHAAPGS